MNQILEEQTRLLDTTDAGAIHLVQVTDCHIFASGDEQLRGMNTRHSFEAVCARAFANEDPLHLVLATGDLSQDGSAKSYDYLAAQFNQGRVPVFWLPGNHDDAALMASRFKGPSIHHEKVILADRWVMILLDSTIAGEVHGQVAGHQLDFMDAALSQFAERHALVCLHHQAQPTGSRWIDEIGLHDDTRLRERLARHPNLRGVLWGHVHQEYHQTIDRIEWMSTPSTCIQFKPASDDFALDHQAPGYRDILLHEDGRIETRVVRIESR